jgi:hypothetical protein
MLMSLNMKMSYMADVFNNMDGRENKFTLYIIRDISEV